MKIHGLYIFLRRTCKPFSGLSTMVLRPFREVEMDTSKFSLVLSVYEYEVYNISMSTSRCEYALKMHMLIHDKTIF